METWGQNPHWEQLEENPEDVEHTNPQPCHPTQLNTIDNTTYYHGPQTTPRPPIPTHKTYILPVIGH